MNADRIAIYERLDKLDDENFSKIIELADVIEQKQREEEAERLQHCFLEMHDLLASDCPWQSEEEMIEELKEDRRRRAGMSAAEFHEQTKAMLKSVGIDYE